MGASKDLFKCKNPECKNEMRPCSMGTGGGETDEKNKNSKDALGYCPLRKLKCKECATDKICDEMLKRQADANKINVHAGDDNTEATDQPSVVQQD